MIDFTNPHLFYLMILKHDLLAYLISLCTTLFLENAFLDRLSQPLTGGFEPPSKGRSGLGTTV
jgi:hypothetical protein